MKRRANGESNPASSAAKTKDKPGDQLGTIVSVTLVNFMCHDNLHFEFAPHVNFIIGQNGSGKSAILTGIMLALGGKSSATGRYSNVKGFIKTGKQKAIINVCLRNCGQFAYKPEVYGDKITVVREINQEGSSCYKMKSVSGHVKGNTKDELSNILKTLDIQVENPLSILTQEMSRTFLLSKQAKNEKLYEFFYIGTGLKKLEENYASTLHLKEDTARQLEKKKQAVPVIEGELKNMKKILDSADKISHYKAECIWATVMQKEMIMKEKEAKLSALERENTIQKRELEQCKNVLSSKRTEAEDFQKRFDECSALISNHKRALLDLNTERQDKQEAIHRLEASCSTLRREERSIKEDIFNIENGIEEQRKRNQSSCEDKERREAAIKHLELQHEEATERLNELKQQKTRRMAAQSQIQTQIEGIVAEKVNIENQLQKLKNDFHRCKESLKNRINIFGEHSENILKEIQRRRRDFKTLPIGPIGFYIDVKEARWCPAVEQCLSTSLLRSFCADNIKDSAILRNILQNFYRTPPPIIVSQFQNDVYDVSRHKAQSNFPTVLEMLNIKHPVVANCLIDQISIENKILVEDMTAAKVLLHNTPRNCNMAFLLNCDQICFNPYRSYANRPRRSILGSLRQDDINTMQADITQKEQERDAYLSQVTALKNQMRELTQEFANEPHQIGKLSTHIRDIKKKMEELMQVEEPRDVYGLQEDLKQNQDEIAKKRAEIEKCTAVLAERKEELDKVSKEMNNQKKMLEGEKKNFDDLNVKLNRYNRDAETLASGKRKFEADLKLSAGKLSDLQQEIEQVAAELEICTREGEKVGPRIETDKTPEELKNIITEMEKVVHKESDCDLDELKRKYIEKHKHLAEVKRALKLKENCIETINKMLTEREKRFKKIRKITMTSVSLSFTLILQANGYQGRLCFDSDEQTLTIDVSPKPTKNFSLVKNFKILSGGERSFVTIAFLLALWERTQMPFRILDEYDVFMDSNNRQLSVDLLIQKSVEKETQFIFLSPLDLPNIKLSERVKVHKMIPPKRITISQI